MDPVRIPITDQLDLHTFQPKELPDLLDDYLKACREQGIRRVRIIHGKGRGILKKRLQSLLKKHPLVCFYQDAPPEAGGWGATMVDLKSSQENRHL